MVNPPLTHDRFGVRSIFVADIVSVPLTQRISGLAGGARHCGSGGSCIGKHITSLDFGRREAGNPVSPLGQLRVTRDRRWCGSKWESTLVWLQREPTS